VKDSHHNNTGNTIMQSQTLHNFLVADSMVSLALLRFSEYFVTLVAVETVGLLRMTKPGCRTVQRAARCGHQRADHAVLRRMRELWLCLCRFSFYAVHNFCMTPSNFAISGHITSPKNPPPIPLLFFPKRSSLSVICLSRDCDISSLVQVTSKLEPVATLFSLHQVQ